MGIVFRQSVKTSLVTFVGAGLGAATLYLSTHLISKQEVGFRQIFITIALLAAQFLLVGMHNTLAVYTHRYHERPAHQSALITISFLLPVLLVVLLSIPYAFLKDPILHIFKPEDMPYISRYYFLVPIFILVFSFQILLEQYLVTQMKVAKASFQKEIVVRLLVIGTIVLYGMHYISFDLLVYSMILVYLLPIAVMFSTASQLKGFRLTSKWNIFSREEKKELVHFAWYHSLLNISVNLIGYLDQVMLPVLYVQSGLESLAAYGVAIFIISFLQIPYRAMVVSTAAIMVQAFRDDDKEKVKDVFTRSSLNILIASVAMFLLISCNLENAVRILPQGYELVAPLVLILSIGKMFDMMTGMNDHAMSFSKYYHYNFYISLFLAVIFVGFNFWFVPGYGPIGAAWASSAALLIYNFIKLFFVKSKLDLFPFSDKTITILGIGCASFAAGYFYPMLFNPYVDTITRSCVVMLIFGGLLILLKPSPDLNQYVASIRKNKRLF